MRAPTSKVDTLRGMPQPPLFHVMDPSQRPEVKQLLADLSANLEEGDDPLFYAVADEDTEPGAATLTENYRDHAIAKPQRPVHGTLKDEKKVVLACREAKTLKVARRKAEIPASDTIVERSPWAAHAPAPDPEDLPSAFTPKRSAASETVPGFRGSQKKRRRRMLLLLGGMLALAGGATLALSVRSLNSPPSERQAATPAPQREAAPVADLPREQASLALPPEPAPSPAASGSTNAAKPSEKEPRRSRKPHSQKAAQPTTLEPNNSAPTPPADQVGGKPFIPGAKPTY